MKTINERRAPEDIQLSGVQKYVLTKLVAAETPSTAYEEVARGGANVVQASSFLTQKGLMTIDEQRANAEITEQGQGVLRDEALVDEMGALTEEGQMWAYANSPEEAAKADHDAKGKPEAPAQPTEAQPPTGGNTPTDTAGVATQDAGGPDAFSIESIQLLRDMNEILKEVEFLKNTKS